MERIVVAVNRDRINEQAIDFACRIADLTNAVLVALFIGTETEKGKEGGLPDYTNLFRKTPEEGQGLEASGPERRPLLKGCRLRKVHSESFEVTGDPVERLIFESRFSDLLLLDPETLIYDPATGSPGQLFIKVLEGAECPVLLPPSEAGEVSDLVFCYDAGRASAFALKQFSYLLPELGHKPALLLETNESGMQSFDEGHRRMIDWMEGHYTSVAFDTLKGKESSELVSYLSSQPNKMIVLGSQGVGRLRDFFRYTKTEGFTRQVDQPIFIAQK